MCMNLSEPMTRVTFQAQVVATRPANSLVNLVVAEA
jgi:hypothetical protein